MNNCRPIQNLILTSYLDGVANSEETGLVDQHLASCSACRNLLTSARLDHQELQTVPRLQAPSHLWHKIHSQITAKENHVNFFYLWLKQLLSQPQRTAWAGFALILILTFFSAPIFLTHTPEKIAATADESAIIIAMVDEREQTIFNYDINLDTTTEYLFENQGETI